MKAEILKVKRLGDEIGYGHLMSIASALWRKSLKEKNLQPYGAFVPTLIHYLKGDEKTDALETCNRYDKIIEENL